MKQESNYITLVKKLDGFIRKYYKNQLLKGVIYALTALLGFYVSAVLIEHFGKFGTNVRTFLFYAFIITNGIIVIKFVVIPLFKLYKLGSIISHEAAAEIIGTHFKDVNDKLLNTLQLKKNLDQDEHKELRISNDLLEAGINQKVIELKPIPFLKAIDLSENKKYLKYAIPPVLLLLLIVFAAPSILRDSTKRLVEHRTYYEEPAPFEFIIENDKLEAIQQEDFALKIKLEGDEIPESVFIEIDDNKYKLQKENTVKFNYLFKNIQADTKFKLWAENIYSGEYNLKTLPNPIILNFEVMLEYPKYIRRKNESIANTGDMYIPQGTKVNWKFNTRNTEQISLSFSDTTISAKAKQKDVYSYSRRFFNDNKYSVATANKYLNSKDSIVYNVNVIEDVHPAIQVQEHYDSTSAKRLYFNGIIKDDYGFKALKFHYSFLKANDKTVIDPKQEENIFIKKNVTHNEFFHYWDLNELDIEPGDGIEYYFEVWDNDGVNGSKSSRSMTKIYKAPTLKELANEADKVNEEIRQELNESIQEAKSLGQDVEELKRQMLEKKQLTWEDKKKMQDK